MPAATILYFAVARERAGAARETLDIPAGVTVKALLDLLSQRHPELAPLLPHLRVAVNREFVREEDQVPAGAELAIIPPVAGGAGLFRVVERPLSLDEVVEAVRGEGMGE